jgi:hypothetical protein
MDILDVHESLVAVVDRALITASVSGSNLEHALLKVRFVARQSSPRWSVTTVRYRCPLDLRMHRVTDCNASKPNWTPSP